MEKLKFNYSLKNISITSKPSYQLKIVGKIENIIKRMVWKTNFFINGNRNDIFKNEAFGFKKKN